MDAPSRLAGLHQVQNAFFQRDEQIVDLLAAAELISVQVQNDEGDVSGETRDAGVGDVLDEPAEDGLQGDFVAVGEGSVESAAVAQGGEDGDGVLLLVAVLFIC